MDSITQAALGASVAHLYWHKPLGRKSLLLGAGFGTLPDLDILFSPLLNDVQRIYWHRGESHSIWFIMLGAMLFSWLLHKYKWKEKMSLATLYWGMFWIFATHILIDYFTIYGTQLLAPLSRYGFAHGNFFIIDPLFTLPLIFGIFAASFSYAKANKIALSISGIYTVFSLGAHTYADYHFRKNLEVKKVRINKSMTAATPFNTLLWRHVVQTDNGLIIGYFSLFDDTSQPIAFQTVMQHRELIEPFKNQKNIKALEWFSKGFWLAQKEDDGAIRFNDVRFGEIRPSWDAPTSSWSFSFSWIITKDEERLQKLPRGEIDIRPALKSLFERI